MDHFWTSVNIQVNAQIYLKNPESSNLGQRIIAGSIDLIDDLGFEQFTFRKLAEAIESTEASVYRYFESKHKLLLYLTAWYWAWMEYRLVFKLANVEPASERLERAIDILTESVEQDSNFSHINEVKLHRIVINESSKAFLNKGVDEINKEGAYIGYKQMVSRVSDIIMEINKNFKYPHMLVSTVIEGAHLQRYFAAHLPRLTDDLEGEDSVNCFYKKMVFQTIQK